LRHERQEDPLQIRVGKAKGASIQKLSQPGDPGPAGVRVEGRTQAFGSIRSSLSASLTARSSCAAPRLPARSIRVRTRLVTGMP
jgi:hypothetical protein